MSSSNEDAGASDVVSVLLVLTPDPERDWLARHSRRHRISVTIDGDTLELERATAGQQRELVDAYVRRHCGR